jgi:hypothetical protein
MLSCKVSMLSRNTARCVRRLRLALHDRQLCGQRRANAVVHLAHQTRRSSTACAVSWAAVASTVRRTRAHATAPHEQRRPGSGLGKAGQPTGRAGTAAGRGCTGLRWHPQRQERVLGRRWRHASGHRQPRTAPPAPRPGPTHDPRATSNARVPSAQSSRSAARPGAPRGGRSAPLVVTEAQLHIDPVVAGRQQRGWDARQRRPVPVQGHGSRNSPA